MGRPARRRLASLFDGRSADVPRSIRTGDRQGHPPPLEGADAKVEAVAAAVMAAAVGEMAVEAETAAAVATAVTAAAVAEMVAEAGTAEGAFGAAET